MNYFVISLVSIIIYNGMNLSYSLFFSVYSLHRYDDPGLPSKQLVFHLDRSQSRTSLDYKYMRIWENKYLFFTCFVFLKQLNLSIFTYCFRPMKAYTFEKLKYLAHTYTNHTEKKSSYSCFSTRTVTYWFFNSSSISEILW